MINVKIGANLRVENPPKEVLNWVQSNLILDNPEYSKKVRMGFWVGNTPKTLRLYRWDANTLILPYGCLNAVLKCGECSIDVDMKPAETVNFNCNIPLYDYQDKAVTAMLDAYYGILQAPAGSGKTQMGLALAAKLGVRTLWLTHTKDLLSQSKNRAELYMNPALIGTITEGKVQVGKAITFATVQTMCNLDLSQYRDVWDCIIVDECHRVAGTPTAVTQFSKVLNSLAARHKHGLSATIHRADGMIAATFALLGDVVYTVPADDVADKIMQVKIIPVQTHTGQSACYLDTDGTLLYPRLINYLCGSTARNTRIISDLCINAAHYNLILSDRLSHLEDLMEMLPDEIKEYAVMISGKMTSKAGKAEREKAIEDVREGDKHFLFATYSLAKEGLDIPRLDRLYLTTPQKDSAVITQAIGRVARTFPEKGTPIVFDYVDDIPYLVKSYKKRCTTYKKAGCTWICQL